MDTPDRGNAAGRYRQLIGCFRRRRGPALQRQQTDDQLYTVDEPMLKFLRQHNLSFRQPSLLLQSRLFTRESGL